ncbi:MAG: hypothetical protein AB7O49_13525 [Sphingomonadales bacterium]
MDWLAKLAVGLVTGLLVYFLYPHDKQARPITAAAFGLVGAAIGGFLSINISYLGGAHLNPTSLAVAAGGAAVFAWAYLNMSS